MAEIIKTKLKTRQQQKHDLEVNWQKATTFIPMQGELIIYDIEVDSAGKTLALPSGRTTPYAYERFKIGDGIHNVNDIPFITDALEEKLSNQDAVVLAEAQAYTDNRVTNHAHGNIANDGTLGTANTVVVTDANKKITTAAFTYTYNSATNTVTFS